MTFSEYCARQAAKSFAAAVVSIAAGILALAIVKYLKKRQATNEGGSGAA